jgi:Cu(I)/Ag(I) efflux system membrane protein CusA/SilA
MLEILVTTRPEFGTDSAGNRIRNWREEIRDQDDLWNAVAAAAAHPALSGSPRLQPIETRWVMLQTGMRSAFGIRLQGSDPDSLTRAALGVERVLRSVPQIRPQSVFAEQLDAKPTLEIIPDRDLLLYAGLSVDALSKQISLYQGQRASVTVLDRGSGLHGRTPGFPSDRGADAALGSGGNSIQTRRGHDPQRKHLPNAVCFF